MIDLYALTSPNVQKIFIMLEECGLPYTVKTVDVWDQQQFTPEFTKINPNQKVPVIVDHEGPGGKPYTVIESGAILIYLAEKVKKFIPTDATARYETLQWLILQIASLGPMSGQLVHFSKMVPDASEYAHKRYRTEVNRLFDLYEQRLAQHPFVAGNEYTIADIAAFPWLRNVALLAIDLGSRPHIKAYVEKIEARDAVKRAYVQVGKITSKRDSATDDAKDRLWGRGKYARA